ncbi:anti-sigma regulatory factor (Ser/Thr protein kinase) [Kitasatospora sp. MAP12-15]|uniref:ATP-binding protein n=1 Tax=unclassified Kitasatospora TaxID=2633591 RepID=UPI00247719EE|nr:ATP-binding protein [Kitasatospora sp. MAP12-44]MDH6113374.1 anti-sigma regulatory factor (Ser/Thr protein kinase) [Kitasatospora sp. MAP12-44]
MTSEIALAQSTDSTPQFAALFGSSRRGARLARLAAARRLTEWGWDRADEPFQNAVLIVAELAANAVTHGHVRGRDFHLLLGLWPHPVAGATLRIEVSDSRGERLPVLSGAATADLESGRGLLLVAGLADRWGSEPRPPSGKTVWCEVDLWGGAAGVGWEGEESA